MSQLFAWGGQSTGVSALASSLPKKTQGWSPYYYFHFTYLKLPGLRKCANNPSVERQILNGGLAGSRVTFLHVYMALCLFPLEKCEHFSGKIWSVIYFCVFSAFNRAILGAQEMSLASWKVLLKHMAPRKGLSSNDTWIQGGKHTHTHTHTHRDTNTYTYPGTHTENYTQKQKHSDTNTHTHTAHLGHFFSNKKVLDDCPKDPQWLSDLVSDLFCTFDGPRSQHWWSCPVIPLCPRGLFSYSNWEIPPEHWWVWLPARPK